MLDLLVLGHGDGHVHNLRERIVHDERRIRVLEDGRDRHGIVDHGDVGVVQDVPRRLDDTVGPDHDSGHVVADHLVRAVDRRAWIEMVDADVERNRMSGEPVHVLVEPLHGGLRDWLLVPGRRHRPPPRP